MHLYVKFLFLVIFQLVYPQLSSINHSFAGIAIFINKIAHLVILVVIKYVFFIVVNRFSLYYTKYKIILVSNMFPKLLNLLYLPLKGKKERNHVSNLVTV